MARCTRFFSFLGGGWGGGEGEVGTRNTQMYNKLPSKLFAQFCILFVFFFVSVLSLSCDIFGVLIHEAEMTSSQLISCLIKCNVYIQYMTRLCLTA